MPGIMFRSGVNITGTGHPKLYADRRMSEGSLLLIDLANTSLDQPNTIASGMKLPNIAWKNALAMIGSGSLDTLSPSLTNVMSPAQGGVELTQNKGIHTITSNTGQTSTVSMDITLPDLIKTYLLAHPTHKFYFGLQYKVTRKFTTADDFTRLHIGNISANTQNYLFLNRRTAINPLPNGNRLGLRVHPNDVQADRWEVGDRFLSCAVSNFTGTLPATIANLIARYKVYPGSGSEILYTLYIEDLTFSSRTYEQVDIMEYQMFLENIADGNRFQSDVFTNPSTLP